MTHTNTSQQFETLYTTLLPKLQRIANQTQGEMTVDDLKGELWLLVQELQSDEKIAALPSIEFQQNILSRLYGRFVKFASKQLRYAIHLDYETDDENCDNKNWLDSLAATSEDPVTYMCRIEEAQQQENRLKSCFSQATAYLKLLENFRSNRSAIAKHLALSWGWLRCKIQRACNHVRWQHSLFDGIEEVADHFMPPPARFKQKKCFPA